MPRKFTQDELAEFWSYLPSAIGISKKEGKLRSKVFRILQDEARKSW